MMLHYIHRCLSVPSLYHSLWHVIRKAQSNPWAPQGPLPLTGIDLRQSQQASSTPPLTKDLACLFSFVKITTARDVTSQNSSNVIQSPDSVSYTGKI